jgi:hypothetical protein
MYSITANFPEADCGIETGRHPVGKGVDAEARSVPMFQGKEP